MFTVCCRMFSLCSLYVQSMLTVYLFYVYSMHVHCMFTMCSLYVHSTVTVYSSMFTVCSVYVLCSIYAHSVYGHCVFTLCCLYGHSMFPLRSLDIHCMFTLCSLYVHSMLTVCLLENISQVVLSFPGSQPLSWAGALYFLR